MSLISLEEIIKLKQLDRSKPDMSSAQVRGSHWAGEQTDEFMKRENGEIHLSAKALRIVWGNDPRFWEWTKISEEDSRFEIGAELIQVNWIEVSGSLDLRKFPLDPQKAYEVIYLIKFKPDAFGWGSSPITFEVSSPAGKHIKKQVLEQHFKNKSWNEIHGGEFYLAASDLTGKIEFAMKEVKTEWWKGGIVIEGVKIRPKQQHA